VVNSELSHSRLNPAQKIIAMSRKRESLFENAGKISKEIDSENKKMAKKK
jgi:hypothetical protein